MLFNSGVKKVKVSDDEMLHFNPCSLYAHGVSVAIYGPYLGDYYEYTHT